jgi:hypothetical protein
MRGGAQAHLLEADDGNFYIVKFQNNLQHRRILVNEAIASEILAHLGIAAPETSLVAIPPRFLTANPDVHLRLALGALRSSPGGRSARVILAIRILPGFTILFPTRC